MTSPTAMARPPSDMRFSEPAATRMTAHAAASDEGIASVATSVARGERKKISMTIADSSAPTRMASRTAAVAAPISVACSYTGVSTTPVGTSLRSCASAARRPASSADDVAADAPRDVDHRRGAARRAHQEARIGVPLADGGDVAEPHRRALAAADDEVAEALDRRDHAGDDDGVAAIGDVGAPDGGERGSTRSACRRSHRR